MKIGIKVFASFFSKFFLHLSVKLTLRVFRKKIKLMKIGIKVFASFFSKFFLHLSVKLTLRVFRKKIKLMKIGIKVFAKLFSKSGVFCLLFFKKVGERIKYGR